MLTKFVHFGDIFEARLLITEFNITIIKMLLFLQNLYLIQYALDFA